MSSVGHVGATRSPQAARPVAPAKAQPEAALLPAAERPALGAMQDAMALLYAVLMQQRDTDARVAKSQVEVAQGERKAALRDQQEALRRASEAAEKGGLFDWVSKDIGLAGAVGLVSFNYGLVAADVAAHKLGVFEHIEEKVDLVDVAAVATGRWEVVAAEAVLRKTDLAPEEARGLLERCGARTDVPGISDEDVEPIAKDLLLANLLVLSVGATVLSCGSTTGLCIALAGLALSYGGSEAAKAGTFDGVFGEGSSQWIGLGMQFGGAAITGAAGLASGPGLVNGANTAAAVASGVSGTANGADKIVLAVHEHERATADIDAEQARYRLARLDRLIQTVIDGAKHASDSHRRAAETIQGVVQTANDTQLMLVRGVRG